jgi:hypothetical protein
MSLGSRRLHSRPRLQFNARIFWQTDFWGHAGDLPIRDDNSAAARAKKAFGENSYLSAGAGGCGCATGTTLTISMLMNGMVALMGKRGRRMACAWEPRVRNSARHRRACVARFIIAIVILQQPCHKRQCNSYVRHGLRGRSAPSETPSPKLQAPEKLQCPSGKAGSHARS